MTINLENLEVNIVEHCNLKCIGCDHSSPQMKKRIISKDTLCEWLRPIKNIRINKLKLIGGEPTLHPDIIEIIKVLKSYNISEMVGVVTNGTRLHCIDEEFWQEIDFLQVTIYPNVNIKISEEELVSRSKIFNFKLYLTKRNIFRHTIVKSKNPSSSLVNKIYERCELARELACHTIRNQRFFKCSPSAFLSERLNLESDVCFKDSVDLSDTINLEKNIVEYLSDKKPLTACWYCLGSCGLNFEVEQYSKLESNYNKYDLPILELLDNNKLYEK